MARADDAFEKFEGGKLVQRFDAARLEKLGRFVLRAECLDELARHRPAAAELVQAFLEAGDTAGSQTPS